MFIYVIFEDVKFITEFRNIIINIIIMIMSSGSSSGSIMKMANLPPLTDEPLQM